MRRGILTALFSGSRSESRSPFCGPQFAGVGGGCGCVGRKVVRPVGLGSRGGASWRVLGLAFALFLTWSSPSPTFLQPRFSPRCGVPRPNHRGAEQRTTRPLDMLPALGVGRGPGERERQRTPPGARGQGAGRQDAGAALRAKRRRGARQPGGRFEQKKIELWPGRFLAGAQLAPSKPAGVHRCRCGVES